MRAPRVLVALSGFLLTGCYHVGVVSPASDRGPAKEESTSYHIFNGLTSAEVSAAECNDGIAKITYYHPWWSILCLGPMTGRLVSATRVTYSCVDAAAPRAPAAVAPAIAPVVPPAASDARPPRTFSDSQKLRDVFNAPAGAAFEPAWKRVQERLARNFPLKSVAADAIQTDWSDALAAAADRGSYRARVRIEVSPDRKKIAVMTQAQWRDGEQWRNGTDSEIQSTVAGQVAQALLGP